MRAREAPRFRDKVSINIFDFTTPKPTMAAEILDDPEHVAKSLWVNYEDDPWHQIEEPLILAPDPRRAALRDDQKIRRSAPTLCPRKGI